MYNKNDTPIFAANPEWTERLKTIPEHSYRSKFQRDRDRILYSKEFRRLSGKTQIFVSGFDDNIRTRLTHTLEVAQIANTISSTIGLNTELTEAIALGHDVGHTPFGHVGERTLNYVMNGCIPLYDYEKNLDDSECGFKHNLQGAKVVTKLEKYKKDEPGLNLTLFTIWGIVNHTKLVYGKSCSYFQEGEEKCRYKNQGKDCKSGELKVGYYDYALRYEGEFILKDKRDWTFEGLVVGLADEIAQRHHDIEDGIYAGIIDYEEIIDYLEEHYKDLLDETTLTELEQQKEMKGYGSKTEAIDYISKTIINLYVTDAIENIADYLKAIKEDLKIKDNKDFGERREKVYEYLLDKQGESGKASIVNAVHFSNNLAKADKGFQIFLTSRILQSELAQNMDGKATYIIRQLIKAYLTNPQQLPDATIIRLVSDYKIGDKELDNTKEEATVASQARSILQTILVDNPAKIRHVLLRVVCDYIAGMTDQYAYKQFNKLYGTGMVIEH